MDKFMKYFGYVRKSDEREDYQVQSPEIQKEWLRETCQRLGVSLMEVFEDHKSAKYPDNRPNFNRMMIELRKGNAVILSIKANRICRNMKEGGEIIHLLENEYIKEIITRDGNYYPYTDTSVLAGQFAMATQFSKTLSKDVISGMNKRAEEAKKWMWWAPTGYMNTMDHRTREKFTVPDPERFDHVRKMFTLAMQGYSQAEISEILYHEGLKSRPIEGPKRKRLAGKVKKTTISEMLRNKFYCGMVRTISGAWVKGEHEGIITPQEFNQLQTRLERKYVKQEKIFPFRGLLKCKKCLSTITSQIQKGHVYYHCNKKNKKCTQKYIKENDLDGLFFNYLKNLDLPSDLVELSKLAVINSNRVKSFLVQVDNNNINNQKNILNNKLYRLIEMRANDEISAEQLQKMKFETELELAKLERREKNKGLLNKQQMEFSAIWIELLNSFSAGYKIAPAPLKNIILKMVGLNWVLDGNKVYCTSLNPIIEIAQKATYVRSGGPLRSWLEQIVTIIFKNIDEIEINLRHFNFCRG